MAENNEGVSDGNGIHFASVESISGAQMPNTTKSIYFSLYHGVSWMWLASHKELKLSLRLGWAGNAEEVKSLCFCIVLWAIKKLKFM